MSRRRMLAPFETEITGLARDGAGLDTTPGGAPIVIRGAPPGSRVAVTPAGRGKGMRLGRRTVMIRPPAAWTSPPCPVFGLCGGCSLLEIELGAQREAKHRYRTSLAASRSVAAVPNRRRDRPSAMPFAAMRR